jgi:hypothetical protein
MPDVRRIPPPAGYAKVLYGNFDAWVETYDIALGDELIERIDGAKERAAAQDAQGRTPELIELGGETFQVLPFGIRSRAKWVLTNDDISLRVRPPSMPFPVSVEFSAAGLAEHGRDALHERLERMLTKAMIHPGKERPRVSRIDWCYDVHSPAFTDEMLPEIVRRFVKPSAVKWDVRGAGEEDGQTLYIGPGSPLMLRVYDKGREIREASGKTWMLDLWEASGQWTRPPRGEPIRHVWRVELEAKRDWLKRRKLDYFDDFNEGGISEMVAEALVTRRLTVPTGDRNRARWPMAPLWTLLLDQKPCDHMRAIGRRYTKRADEIASMLIDMAAGVTRTAGFLTDADYATVAAEAELRYSQDSQLELKLDRTRKRYAGVNEAR